MAKFVIQIEGGQFNEVAGRKFSHYVANVRFWFFYHAGVVSHHPSGLRVCSIPDLTVAACLNDRKAAAKLELDKLIALKGADRVYKALIKAEKNL